MINTHITIKNITLSTSAGLLAYAITFLMTDIIGQIWGKKEANQAVIYGFIAQIVCTGLIYLTPLIFKPWFIGSDTYNSLNSLGWFTLGSLIAYICSQTWDIFIFHKIKNWASKKFDEKNYNKYRWLWNNGSTLTSQIIDTIIFVGIGFGIGLNISGNNLIGIMIGQYCIKFIIALLDTPLFYLFTKNYKEQ